MTYTKTQRDVLAKMRDGWQLHGNWMFDGNYGDWQLINPDRSASVSVPTRTVRTLKRHGIITFQQDDIWHVMGVLA